MKSKKLSKINRYLLDPEFSKKMRILSIASSTAIETGESIKNIESKILNQKLSDCPVKLA